jgi:HEPN domain-containing protein
VNPDIEQEFQRAEAARARGNEGQARVCARRAAGLAARAYLERQGRRPATASAYDLLKGLAADETLAAELREIAGHLILRVDEQFKLPAGLDLIAEARRLCEALP